MEEHKGYTVVTGASMGLGAAFAEACAKRGQNLVLAALPGTGLGEVATRLRDRYGVAVEAIETDLSTKAGQEGFLATVLAEGRRVSLLINNVGMASNGLFDLIPLENQRRCVDLNIQSTMALTYGLIPRLSETPGAGILTVASLSALYPMPLFAVYAATKAFLLNWSLALRQELGPLGIRVCVLAPGGINTTAEIREKNKAQGLAGRLSSQEPEAVAEEALDRMPRAKGLVIPGRFNRILAFLGRFSPKNFTAAAIFWRWNKVLGRLEDNAESQWYLRDKGAA
jgi:short-subunit dehydrogenase